MNDSVIAAWFLTNYIKSNNQGAIQIMSAPKTITIDDVEYVQKDSVATPAKNTEGLPYAIVRADRAGVFAGYVAAHNDKNVKLLNARRIWQWAGAATLSQLAVDGTSKPANCKFPNEVPEIYLTDAIEIIPATEKARQSIASVTVWQQ